MRMRYSWIPLFVREERLLLRIDPTWGDVWYWPSVTDDGGFRTAPAFFDALCAELEVDRAIFFSGRSPLRIREFYEEILHVPSAEPAAYHFRVVDLSFASGSIRAGEFTARSGRAHRWIDARDVAGGRTEQQSVQPEVSALWNQLRNSP